MPTINATPGHADANSYATVAEADAYMDGSITTFHTETWDGAGEDDKAKALITATRMLDDWYDWDGYISSTAQRLLWPRRSVLRGGISQDQEQAVHNVWHEPFGVFLDANTIPEFLRDACSELAGQLIASNRTADSDVETQGIRSLDAGSVSIEFRDGGVRAKPIPDMVATMVSRYGRLRDKYGPTVVRVLRG